MVALRIIGVIVGIIFVALGAFGATLTWAARDLPRPRGLLLVVLPARLFNLFSLMRQKRMSLRIVRLLSMIILL